MEQLIKKIENYSNEFLMNMAKELMNDKREESEIVMNTILDVLMSRMSENAFIKFCDSL